jgi:protein phosphatase
VRIDIAARSDAGNVREANEDHYLVARTGRYLSTLLTNLPDGEVPARFDETGYVMVVADGMGGAVGGEVASRMAISNLVNIVLHVPDWILRLDEERAQELTRRAGEYYRRVNEALIARVKDSPELTGMGSTMTATCSMGSELFLAHVGDSRAYLYREQMLQRLTRDQTHAQMLADAGVIRQEEVATHRLRNVLTNALGGLGDEVKTEIQRCRLKDGDWVLLCTDGLTDMVGDELISSLLRQSPDATTACEELVNQALENGGRDNVTVVVARYFIPEG